MATVNLGRIKFVWQGAYNGATAYVADDVVSYNGSSYICILASTGNLPTNTTYWNQMSQAGTNGTNGTNGTDVGTVITTQGDLLYRDASGLQRLGAGTSGQFLKTNGTGANPAWATLSDSYGSALLHIRDEKASGTGGGAFTAGAWQTRTLNTSLTNQISGASLSSNQITLPSGTYHINALATANYVRNHKIKLRNITDSSDTLIGVNSYAAADAIDDQMTNSYLNGRFTISAQKTFELQHRCGLTSGYGVASSFSVIEVYADVQIWKVA